jgi:hypothetical protein
MWKDYAAYIGGKGRYYTIKYVGGPWRNIYRTGKEAEAVIKPLAEAGQLEKLIETK